MSTAITRMLGIRYPLLAAPMFLISNVDMVVAVSEAGGLGCFPALNYRSTDAFRNALREIKARTDKPYGVNLILWDNARLDEDLAVVLEERVPLIITSMGNPSAIVEAARVRGLKVFCDVINLKHAEKCVAAGADGLIAVAQGAGGHAGTITPFVLVPHLRKRLGVPVVAAGSIVDGKGMAAALALGAEAVYVGTRFIASAESPADQAFKDMILRAAPEDIVYTPEVSGHHANFLKGSLERFRAQGGKRWKDAWSAGQGSALIEDVRPCAEIVRDMVAEYEAVRQSLPGL